MTDKQENKAIGMAYAIAAFTILLGAFFRLQHYPNGLLILFIGFVLGTVTNIYDTIRLRKKVKQLEEQLNQKD